MKKIKRNDEIIVISGRDKGRKGKVLQVLKNNFVLVEDVNTVKKHIKQDPNNKNKNSGGVSIQAHPIHLCKVMYYDHSSGKGVRLGIRTLEDGRKVRYIKKTNEQIDV